MAAGVAKPCAPRDDSYLPDLNPTEMLFSQKDYPRRAGKQRISRLRRRIGSFARILTARNAAFEHLITSEIDRRIFVIGFAG
jgi:hypothetical protein